MGIRLRKSIKLAPGVRVNVTQNGISSVSLGRGASININAQGIQANLGIPGTGLSYRTKRKNFKEQ